MSDFHRALRSFDVGSLSMDELLAEVDRQLASSRTDPVTMLAWLDEENARAALPHEIHEAISEKIHASLGLTVPHRPQFAPAEPTEFLRIQERHAARSGNVAEESRRASPPSGGAQGAVAPIVGTILKQRFKLVACLGEGGAGRVYKALDLRRVEAEAEDVYVAVKLLTGRFASYPGALSLLQREATRLQRLSHANIVRVLDCDRDGDMVFMTMEYLAGESLKQKLDTSDVSKRSRDVSMHVLERIAEALAFAHRHDTVHGDLKPANVIVTHTGEVKVIDFGVARAIAAAGHQAVAAEDDDREPTSGLTPAYASPEALESQPPDPRDDIYALSCIAYELLTGVHPFGRRPATEVRAAHGKLARRSPLSRAQFRALRRGLRFDREKRTPTVEHFIQDLRGERPHTAWRVLGGAAGVVAAAGTAYLIYEVRMDSTVALRTPGELFRDCETCPLMKVVAPGRFEQGSASGTSSTAEFERPRHMVALARPFALGVQEVTRAQFGEFIAATGREMSGCVSYDGAWVDRADLNWNNVGYAQSELHPVTCTSWRDATAYAEWLSRKTGQRYRLPSASEWEYAARAGAAAQPRPADAAQMCAAANVADEAAAQRYPGWSTYACNDGYVYTAPVSTFSANAFGLSDMLGNVFEWVQDCWHDDYRNAPTDGSPWVNGECKEREMRGASWFTSPEYVRAEYRNRFDPDYRSTSIGFRLVRELQQ